MKPSDTVRPYKITLHGWDEPTEFIIGLRHDELLAVSKVAHLSHMKASPRLGPWMEIGDPPNPVKK